VFVILSIISFDSLVGSRFSVKYLKLSDISKLFFIFSSVSIVSLDFFSDSFSIFLSFHFVVIF
jgi:hypothetical protein